MYIKQLKLVQFKNHIEFDLDPHPKWNVITGLNGYGKTNALDGIYLLCVLKSFLNHSLDACISAGRDFFRIEAEFSLLDKTTIKYPKHGTRQININGKRITKTTNYIGRYPVIIIQPIDDYRLFEGSAARRKIIDQAISQFDTTYLQSLISYTKLIKQRNILLKQIRQRKDNTRDQLRIYDKQLFEYMQILHSGREKLINSMRSHLELYYNKISNNRELPTVDYAPNTLPSDYPREMSERHEVDILSGRTTCGPHLDDIVMSLNGDMLKTSGSQGQRKSFLLSLKLAIYQYMAEWSSKLPILLLDDLFDKLDNERVQNLLTLIHESNFGQVFITDKDHEHITSIFTQLKYEFNHLKL